MNTTATGNVVPVARIIEDDVVICFNFRTDRGREITEVLSQKDFPGIWNEEAEPVLYHIDKL